MFLQSVMLLLREQGLDSCAQECWAVYPKTIGDFIGIPPGRMLFTGMAIGWRNPEHTIHQLRAHPPGRVLRYASALAKRGSAAWHLLERPGP